MTQRRIRSVIVAALLLGACGEATLGGNGDVVTEERIVSSFDAVAADNGVHVSVTVDPGAQGLIALAVTTDSNLLEFLSTTMSGTNLAVSTDRGGGVSPTGPFDVAGRAMTLREVSADDGATVGLAGRVPAVTLTADNGARINADDLTATNVSVDLRNGARVTVCATGAVVGSVTDGARLTVLCGGKIADVATADGGKVSTPG